MLKNLKEFSKVHFISFLPMVYSFSFRNAAQSNSSYLDQNAAVESSSLAEDYNGLGL